MLKTNYDADMFQDATPNSDLHSRFDFGFEVVITHTPQNDNQDTRQVKSGQGSEVGQPSLHRGDALTLSCAHYGHETWN